MALTSSRLRIILREETHRVLREMEDIGSIMDSLYDYSLEELQDALQTVESEGTFNGMHLGRGEKMMVVNAIKDRIESMTEDEG